MKLPAATHLLNKFVFMCVSVCVHVPLNSEFQGQGVSSTEWKPYTWPDLIESSSYPCRFQQFHWLRKAFRKVILTTEEVQG